jgi:hypothetical protein
MNPHLSQSPPDPPSALDIDHSGSAIFFNPVQGGHPPPPPTAPGAAWKERAIFSMALDFDAPSRVGRRAETSFCHGSENLELFANLFPQQFQVRIRRDIFGSQTIFFFRMVSLDDGFGLYFRFFMNSYPCSFASHSVFCL